MCRGVIGAFIAALIAWGSVRAQDRSDEQAPTGSSETDSRSEAESETGSETETGSASDATGEADEGAEDEGANAASASEQAPPQSVAILLVAVQGDDADIADAASEVLVATVASRGGVRIVGKEEVQARLERDERGTLECVSAPACLGRVGVSLGVDQIIAGTLSRRPSSGWAFNLDRFDIRSGETVGHVVREVDGDTRELAGALQDAAARLYETRVRPVTLRISVSVRNARVVVDGVFFGTYDGAALVTRELEPGVHLVRVEADGFEPWQREVELEAGAELQIDAGLVRLPVVPPPPLPVEVQPRGLSPVVWVGSGVLVAGAAATIIYGLRSQRAPDEGINRAEALAFVDNRERDALVSNIGIGAMAVGVGMIITGLLLSDFGGGRGHLRASVALDRTGGQLTLGGSL